MKSHSKHQSYRGFRALESCKSHDGGAGRISKPLMTGNVGAALLLHSVATLWRAGKGRWCVLPSPGFLKPLLVEAMFDEASDDPAHVLLGVSQGLDNVGDASVGFDHRGNRSVLSIPEPQRSRIVVARP
jgi:hypothetical protein